MPDMHFLKKIAALLRQQNERFAIGAAISRVSREAGARFAKAPPNVKIWLRAGVTAIGALAVVLLIWFASPIVAVGGWHPFDDGIVRFIAILAVIAAIGGTAAYRFYQRKQGAELIARGMGVDDSDAPVLAERMQDALSTLRGIRGGRANYLYDLPWYMLIGPPGSGKTTALINSGLEFPLAGGAKPGAIAGVGGTRYCDWWFTEDAVLIDTAGRYTTQDSDAKADKRSWLAFLDLLKRSRPRQPINGVIVAISLEDLLTLPAAELAAHADAIRSRLLELHQQLNVDFPVYALFTKADLVIGFMEFFNDLNEASRGQVWGATFQTSDKGRNMVGQVPGEFDALIGRLNAELPQKLERERDATGRVMLFGFPAQMAALRNCVADFLFQIFDPARYQARASLRGFYFTSGTQEGTPIDQLLGALAKGFGAQGIAAPVYSGQGKSFFLTDLIKKVVIGEAGWVSTGRGNRIAHLAAYTALAIVTPLTIGSWWVAYAYNSSLIRQSEDASSKYKALNVGTVATNTISDHDLANILPALHALRYMPGGYLERNAPTSRVASFGLDQGLRLRSASETAYQVGLERMLRPRLVQRLEEQLEANINDPNFLFEALKVYLMLGGLKTVDRPLVIGWMQRDWSENVYPGPRNADGRRELEQHLVAMLDLEGSRSFVSLNGPLVARCQQALVRVNIAEHAFDRLMTRAQADLRDDWTPARMAGAGASVVFDDTIDSIRVPYFFTRAGYEQAFVARLGFIGQEMTRDRWVLGDAGQQPAISLQYDRLQQNLVDLYTEAFISTWQTAIGKLHIRRLTVERPAYPLLAAASSVTSPISRVLEAIGDETTLPARAGAQPALEGESGQTPAAAVGGAFRAYRQLVEGSTGRRPIDLIVLELNDIRSNLSRLAGDAVSGEQLRSRLTSQVGKLKSDARGLPPPFSQIMAQVADDVTHEIADSAIARTVQTLRTKVTLTCEDLITSRYPFTRASRSDVALADFARMFAPNGLIDQFVAQNMVDAVDSSGPEWRWREDTPLSRQLGPTALADFQRAAQIRDTFFAGEGGSPGFTISVTPAPVNGARMEVDSTIIAGRPGNIAPVSVQWPGSSEPHHAAIVYDVPGRSPANLEMSGPWALYRLLDAGQSNNDGTAASFVLGGRELRYRFDSQTPVRPLNLGFLRSFHCPNGI